MPKDKDKKVNFYEEMLGCISFIDEYKKDEIPKTIENIEKESLLTTKLSRGISAFVGNFFKKRGILEFEATYRSLIFDKTEEEKDKLFVEAGLRVFRNVYRGLGRKFDNKIEDKPIKEQLAFIRSNLNEINKTDDKLKEEIFKGGSAVLANDIITYKYKNLRDENTFKAFYKNIQEKYDNLDEFYPKEEEYLTFRELGDSTEVHLADKEIDELLESNKDTLTNEEKLALEDAKNILVKGDNSVVSIQSGVVEKCGNESEKKVINDTYKYANSKNVYGDSIEVASNGLRIKNDVQLEKQVELATNAVNSKSTFFSEEDKKAIIDLVEYCEQNGIYEYKGSGEDSFKTYSFIPLVRVKDNLAQAVKNKDTKKIVELQTKYRDLESKYDKALEMVSKLGIKDVFPANVSSSRVESVPFKYRADYINASKLNGLLISMRFMKSQNVELKTFLDDPLNTFKNISHDFLSQSKAPEIYKDMENSTDAIGDLISASDTNSIAGSQVYHRAADSTYLFQRGISGLKNLITNEENRREFDLNFDIVNDIFYCKILDEETGITTLFQEKHNPVETICNFLFAEKEDRDFRKISAESTKHIDADTLKQREKFDRFQYLDSGKTTVDKVFNRFVDFSQNFIPKFGAKLEVQLDRMGLHKIIDDAIVQTMEYLKTKGLTQEQMEIADHIIKVPTPEVHSKLRDLISKLNFGEVFDDLTGKEIEVPNNENIEEKSSKQNELQNENQSSQNSLNENTNTEQLVEEEPYVYYNEKDNLLIDADSEGGKVFAYLKKAIQYVEGKESDKLKPEEVVEYYRNENIITRTGGFLASELFSGCKSLEDIDKFVSDNFKNVPYEPKAQIKLTLSSYLSRKGRTLQNELDKLATNEEKDNFINNEIASLNENEFNDFKNLYAGGLSAKVTLYEFQGLKTIDGFNKFADFVVRHDGLFKTVPAEKDYKAIPDFGASIEENPYKEDMEALNIELENKKYGLNEKNALKVADEILKESEESADYLLKVSESVGQACDRVKTDGIQKYIDNADYLPKGIYRKGRTHISVDFNKVNNSERVNNANTILNQPKIGFSDKEKEGILEVCKLIDQNGLISKDKYTPEWDVKTYAFSKLYNTKLELAKAVKEHDIDKTLTLTSEYYNLSKEYDKMIDIIKGFSKDLNIQSNVSSSRVKEIPYKYRNDYIGASKLTTIFLTKMLLDHHGIPMKDYLDDPVKTNNLIFSKTYKEDYNVGKYVKEASISELIKELDLNKTGSARKDIDSVLKDVSKKDTINTKFFERGGTGLLSLIDDVDRRQELQGRVSVLHGFLAERLILDFNNGISYLIQNQESRIENLLLVEKEDRDLISLSEPDVKHIDYENTALRDAFNKDEYLRSGKTNPASIMLRTMELYKSLSNENSEISCINQAKSAIENTINYVKTLDRSETMNHIISAIENDTPDKIHKTDIVNMKAEAEFNKGLNGGLTKESIGDSIKQIADLQAKYNSRNFFATIFYSSVRREYRIIENMKQTLISNGVDKDRLNEALRGYKNNNQDAILSSVNAIKESFPLPKAEEVNEHKQIIGLEVKELSVENEKSNEAIEALENQKVEEVKKDIDLENAK